MPLSRFIAGQLRKPSGWFGKVVMARLLNRFNAPMNTQALGLLGVQPADRVLEVGFGGGELLGRLAAHATDGQVVGVDFAPEMVERGERRYRALVEAGRVAFRCADIAALPYPDAHFTKVCTNNTLYFWDDPARVLAELHRVLAPGGVLVIGFAPRQELESRPFVAYGFTLYDADEVGQMMEKAGFGDVRIEPGAVGKHTFFCGVGTKFEG